MRLVRVPARGSQMRMVGFPSSPIIEQGIIEQVLAFYIQLVPVLYSSEIRTRLITLISTANVKHMIYNTWDSARHI